MKGKMKEEKKKAKIERLAKREKKIRNMAEAKIENKPCCAVSLSVSFSSTGDMLVGSGSFYMLVESRSVYMLVESRSVCMLV